MSAASDGASDLAAILPRPCAVLVIDERGTSDPSGGVHPGRQDGGGVQTSTRPVNAIPRDDEGKVEMTAACSAYYISGFAQGEEAGACQHRRTMRPSAFE